MKNLFLLSLSVFLLFSLTQCVLFKGVSPNNIGMIQRTYGKQEVILEMDSLQKLLENVHPNLYHARKKDEIKQICQDIKDKLPPYLSRKEYYYVFSCFLSEYNDGHINTFPFDANSGAKNRNFLTTGKLLPFELYRLNNQVFVTSVWDKESAIQSGDVLLSINGHNADSLFVLIQKSISGGSQFQAYYGGSQFCELLNLFNISSPYHIFYLSAKDGNIKETKENGLLANKIAANKWKWGRTACLDTCKYMTFKIIQDDIAYINLHSFYAGEDIFGDIFRDHLTKEFSIIKQKKIRKLIIDMRENTGGYLSKVNDIVSFLSEKQYPVIKKIGTRASYELAKTYSRRKKDKQKRMCMLYYDRCTKKRVWIPFDSIHYDTCFNEKYKATTSPYLFTGKSCFLIGPGSYSATTWVAHTIKDNKISTLIGESPDEPINDYGNPFLFYLPKSHILVTTPTASFYASSRADTDTSKVIPDIMVKPDKNSLLKGEDAVLNKAIEWLNTTQN